LIPISGKHFIPAPKQQVWVAMNTPVVLEKSIRGCENVQKLTDEEWLIAMAIRVGPIKSSFAVQLLLQNLYPPDNYTLRGIGQSGLAESARGFADVSLADAESGTDLTYSGEFEIGGALGNIAPGIVSNVANRVSTKFFKRFAECVVETAPMLTE